MSGYNTKQQLQRIISGGISKPVSDDIIVSGKRFTNIFLRNFINSYQANSGMSSDEMLLFILKLDEKVEKGIITNDDFANFLKLENE